MKLLQIIQILCFLNYFTYCCFTHQRKSHCAKLSRKCFCLVVQSKKEKVPGYVQASHVTISSPGVSSVAFAVNKVSFSTGTSQLVFSWGRSCNGRDAQKTVHNCWKAHTQKYRTVFQNRTLQIVQLILCLISVFADGSPTPASMAPTLAYIPYTEGMKCIGPLKRVWPQQWAHIIYLIVKVFILCLLLLFCSSQFMKPNSR